MRRYLIQSIENMRDLGGYQLSNNKTIPYQKMIRSNLPANINDTDIQFLKDIGITSVVDLRTVAEYTRKKSVFEERNDFSVYHCPIQRGSDIPSSPDAVPLSYLDMLNEKESIHRFFQIIIQEKGGILFFCNAGKDRTGTLTTLLFILLGVKKKDIIADYLLSSVYMHDILFQFAQATNPDIYNIINPKKENIEVFLELFSNMYGSIENYLSLIGLSKTEIEKIHIKFMK